MNVEKATLLNGSDYSPRHALQRIERELGTERFHEFAHRRMQILKYIFGTSLREETQQADVYQCLASLVRSD